MKNLTRTAQVMLAVSATALLVACGSGNNAITTTGPDGGPVVPGVTLVPGTEVPVSASSDFAAATEFVRSVVARAEADTDTPLVVGDAVLATSDTADPAAI